MQVNVGEQRMQGSNGDIDECVIQAIVIVQRNIGGVQFSFARSSGVVSSWERRADRLAGASRSTASAVHQPDRRGLLIDLTYR